MTQTYSYDSLHRLTSGTTGPSMTVSYDQYANITSLSTSGTMAYADTLAPYTLTSYVPSSSASTRDAALDVTYTASGRDYLGSIIAVANASGTVVERDAWDPWGRALNPSSLTQYSVGSEPALALGRGFTGHEWLPWFSLWNANARIYDPLLGRFLSPDPYVQAPGFTQNFNRFAYALNNPLKYTDENGEFFIIDSYLVGLFGGGWKRARQMAKNDIKIWGGLFIVDKNRDGIDEFFSRITWQLPQTLFGFISAHSMNTFRLAGGIEDVDYLHGATVLRSNKGGWGGFTLGSYIMGSSSIRPDDNNFLFQHEFGHYLQSQEHGWLWIFTYGIESLGSAIINKPEKHNRFYTEQDANARSFKYLAENYGSRYAETNWKFKLNPIKNYDRGKAVINNNILTLHVTISKKEERDWEKVVFNEPDEEIEIIPAIIL